MILVQVLPAGQPSSTTLSMIEGVEFRKLNSENGGLGVGDGGVEPAESKIPPTTKQRKWFRHPFNLDDYSIHPDAQKDAGVDIIDV